MPESDKHIDMTWLEFLSIIISVLVLVKNIQINLKMEKT